MGLRPDRHLGFGARQLARGQVAGVIGAADNDGLIGIAIQKLDDHLMANAWHGRHAPTWPRPGL
ncbi:hypothetical protein D3C80_1699920 [compost metagenome]